MAGVKHTFSVAIADDASAVAAGMVLPSHWNSEHTLSDVPSQTSLDALSQAVSVADAALSVRIDTASALATTANNHADTVSNAVSVLSQAVSVGNAALSVRIDTVSQAHSVLSQAVSVADAALSVRIDTQSQSISVLSQAHSALSQSHSVLSQAVSVADAALSVRIDTQSQAISVLSQLHSVLSQAHSALSQTNSVDHAALSLRITSVAGLGGGSVTSTEFSNLQSAHDALSNLISGYGNLSQGISVLSQQVSVLSQAVSVLSDAVSVLSNQVSAAGGFFQTVVQNIQTVSATALTNVSGMVLTLAANGVYRIEGAIMHTFSATSVSAWGFGFTYPTMTNLAGRMEYASAIGQNVVSRNAFFTAANPGSGGVVLSAATLVASATTYYTNFQAIADVGAGAGNFQLQTKANATAGAIHILKGTWMRVYKIA